MRPSKSFIISAALASTTLLLSSCLASSGGGGDKNGLGANKNTGKSINMLVAFGGDQLAQFKSAILPYAKSQGISLSVASDSNFNADVVNKVKSGNVPDIALFPQPGIMAQMAQQGKLADLKKVGIDISGIEKNMVVDIPKVGTVNGTVYALPPSINVKSLVFYPKKPWVAAGYTAPATLNDLLTLSAKIKSDGKTPWCMGIESGTGTGWPATDWLEQLVLNQSGLSVYNDWVTHKVKFDSPQVKQAGTYYQKIFSTPGWVYGGQKSIAGTNFGTAGNPMFAEKNTESKPGCYMFKQGNFITGKGFFPTAIVNNLDAMVGAFPFPGKTAGDHPVEGGGDVAALFSGKNKNAIKLMKYMLSPQFCGTPACAKQFAFISPFKNYALSNYPNNLSRAMAQTAYKATTFAFDASDQMPGAVGTGSFWKQMTAWIGGTTSMDAAFKAIDASWPT